MKFNIGDKIKLYPEDKKNELLEGIIGEIDNEAMYVWSNDSEFNGSKELIKPSTKAYLYSWKVRFDSAHEIISHTSFPVDIHKLNQKYSI